MNKKCKIVVACLVGIIIVLALLVPWRQHWFNLIYPNSSDVKQFLLYWDGCAYRSDAQTAKRCFENIENQLGTEFDSIDQKKRMGMYLTLSDKFFAEGNYSQALKEYERVLRCSQDEIDELEHTWRVYLMALSRDTDGLAREKDDPKKYTDEYRKLLNVATAYAKGEYKKIISTPTAETQPRQKIELNNMFVSLLKARVLRKQGDVKGAWEVIRSSYLTPEYKAYLKRNTTIVFEVMFFYMKLAYETGHYEEAREYAQTLLDYLNSRIQISWDGHRAVAKFILESTSRATTRPAASR